MATIVKRVSSTGEISYRAHIRMKGLDISRTFFNEEDAKLYVFYKERLIQYLSNNNILYFDPLSFDEASFLIWMNEIKKEYYNGNHC